MGRPRVIQVGMKVGFEITTLTGYRFAIGVVSLVRVADGIVSVTVLEDGCRMTWDMDITSVDDLRLFRVVIGESIVLVTTDDVDASNLAKIIGGQVEEVCPSSDISGAVVTDRAKFVSVFLRENC